MALMNYDEARQRELYRLEVEIDEALRAPLVIGQSLTAIKMQGLHVDAGYDRIEDYAKARWDIKSTHCFQLMEYADTIEVINSNSAIAELELRESHTRELSGLKDEQKVEVINAAVDENNKLTAKVIREIRERLETENGWGNAKKEPTFSSIIKPMDNWAFGTPNYPKPEHVNGKGYIVGDIYANAFWYYVKEGYIVVDPMAGSGLAQHVYDDRVTWMKSHIYNFELHLFDLTPQQSFITQHNLMESFPLPHADYIFMDVPYFDIVNGAYSDKSTDVANMDMNDWIKSMETIAKNCASAQKTNGLCSVLCPNWRNIKTNERLMATHVITCAWLDAGYELHDKAYCTRRIQKTQSTGMAMINNTAKRERVMLTDIAELITFRLK